MFSFIVYKAAKHPKAHISLPPHEFVYLHAVNTLCVYCVKQKQSV